MLLKVPSRVYCLFVEKFLTLLRLVPPPLVDLGLVNADVLRDTLYLLPAPKELLLKLSS